MATVAPPDWEEITAIAAAGGVDHLGVAAADVLTRARAALFERRASGLAADMQFTYRNPERSTDPQRAVPGARSIIVGALAYPADVEPPPPTDEAPARVGAGWARIARYARDDYYGVLRRTLGGIAARLKAAGERAVVFADDNSLVDREVAYLAGLGWFGKNANLLVPGAGSFFVLGSVVTTAAFDADSPVGDGCGGCRRCIDGCPTAAIVAPGVIDANRCLAWLVQRAGTFPVEYRRALGDRFYGCDECQDVCPPTVRHRGRRDPLAEPEPGDSAWVDLGFVLTADDEALLARFAPFYIAERDPRWWRRTALVVAGNVTDGADREMLDLIDDYATGPDPILAEHARWALGEIERRSACDATEGPR